MMNVNFIKFFWVELMWFLSHKMKIVIYYDSWSNTSKLRRNVKVFWIIGSFKKCQKHHKCNFPEFHSYHIASEFVCEIQIEFWTNLFIHMTKKSTSDIFFNYFDFHDLTCMWISFQYHKAINNIQKYKINHLDYFKWLFDNINQQNKIIKINHNFFQWNIIHSKIIIIFNRLKSFFFLKQLLVFKIKYFCLSYIKIFLIIWFSQFIIFFKISWWFFLLFKEIFSWKSFQCWRCKVNSWK